MSVTTITMPAPRVAAMQRLFAAFRTTPTESMASAYKDGLADVPDDILTRAVFAAIQAEKFLPSVAELRMYADRFAAPPETRTPPASTGSVSSRPASMYAFHSRKWPGQRSVLFHSVRSRPSKVHGIVEVPPPATNASGLMPADASCDQISGPVVRKCASTLASFEN